MNEPTSTEQVDNEQPDDATEVEQPDNDAQDSSNAEAAKWRKRLRETEAERDELREQVEALQRQQVDQLVTAAGLKPAAVWKTTELAALLGDDGTVSADLVTAAVERARDELGVQPLGKGGAPVPGIGARPEHKPQTPDQAFKEAFAPRRR